MSEGGATYLRCSGDNQSVTEDVTEKVRLLAKAALKKHDHITRTVHDKSCPTRYCHGQIRQSCECVPIIECCDCETCITAKEILGGR